MWGDDEREELRRCVDQIKGDSLRSYVLQSVTKIPIRNELCEMAVREDHYKIDTLPRRHECQSL